MLIWVGDCAQLSMALTFDIGPVGPRVTLDPERLIAADTTAVTDYLATQLARHYPGLTSDATRCLTITKELNKTIEMANDTFLKQEQRSASKKTNKNKNSDPINGSA